MDLEIIREFVILADNCNFQLAAALLSLSQSSLSKHIHKLEEELDLELFDRSKRTVTLNENGKVFLGYAREFCKIGDECSFALKKSKENSINSLSVGFVNSHAQYSLVERMTDFCNIYPEIHLNMLEQNGANARPALTSGECDFIFTAEGDDFEEEDFGKVVYKRDRLVVILPSSHPLASKEFLTIQDVMNENLIEHNTDLEQRLFRSLYEPYGYKPKFVASISYAPTIMRMVSKGMGIAVIGEGSVDQHRLYNLVKVGLEPTVEHKFYLVYKQRGLTKEAKKFIDFFKEDDSMPDPGKDGVNE